ncbi:MAG: hypothetical protein HYV40_05350 [Candidatus Levybacteria bacterium]|nr:hypothetical protein [Candidatus Levybacteria bacterium]
MPRTHLPFGKIVATPTPIAWSQAYGAGGLFLTLSLTSEEREHEKELGTLGKKLINDLEAEFFALEEKSLTSIKAAIDNTFFHIPPEIKLSAAIAFVKEHILYVYLLGNGSILLRRSGTLGTILKATHAHEGAMQTASGHLQSGDLVILQTHQFEALIPEETLTKTLVENETAEEIAETLSPLIHGREDGGAGAIFFTFSQIQTPLEEEDETSDELLSPAPSQPETQQGKAVPQSPFPDETRSFPHPALPQEEKQRIPSLPSFSKLRSSLPPLSHRQRLLMSIAAILILVLGVSIFFANKNAEEKRTKEVFAKIYDPAKQHFEEGQGLIELNTALAREELEEAQSIIGNADKTLPAGSREAKQLATLKTDIANALSELASAKQTSVTPVGVDKSKLLGALVSDKKRLFATQDEDNVYFLTKDEIGSIGKSDDAEKTLVENDGDWSKPSGLGTFLGNLYVLDKEDGINKFVKGSEGYGGKTAYLTGEKPDLSQAVGIAIDSSIYVLFLQGDISKFTRGTPVSFKVSGLDMPFKSPTRIYMTPDFSAIYVLDNGNGRIVKLGKDGVFQSQYQAAALTKAQDFEVDETNKKAYILSGGKVYEMKLE